LISTIVNAHVDRLPDRQGSHQRRATIVGGLTVIRIRRVSLIDETS